MQRMKNRSFTRKRTAGTVTAPLHTAMAELLLREGRFEEAERAYRKISAELGDNVTSLVNYGATLKHLGRFDEAEPVLRRAVSLDPQRYSAWSNLGCVMLEKQRYDDAIAALSNAIRINPSHAASLSAMGVTLRRRGLPAEALTFYNLALSIDPRNAETRYFRSMALLATGDYLRGFAEYEWRLHRRAALPHVVNAPHWKGEPLAGRTLLVEGEEGLGDMLQFARYIPFLKALDGRVILRVPAPLVSLFSRLPGVDAVVVAGEAVADFDLVCPIMSLPYVFRTTIDSIPFPGGYLSADPAVVDIWAARLAEDARRRGATTPLRVGLVWAGGKRPWNLDNMLTDRRRSTELAALAPLAEAAPGILFYSLQVGDCSSEAAEPPHPMHLIDHTAHIRSFDDTAGLVSLLDLVIAVDTSTAHLAAALGRPVWLLSRYDQCWRWLVGRDDSPWYDTMRLYVQPAPFDWTSPLLRMARDLARLAENGAVSSAVSDTSMANLRIA